MKKLLIFAAVATMFAACSKDATQDLAATKPIDKFYATIAGNDSRVQLNDVCKTVWTSGDRVSVFNKTTGNRRYKFTGNTGDTVGELSYMNGGTTGSAIDKVVAIYPYNTSNSISTDGTITTVVPATQTYCKDSFGIGSCIMVAHSNTDKLSFQNVVGWIRIALTGDQTIKSIILWGRNNELLAGKATINDDLSVKLDSNATKLVTLDCGEGVQLSAEPTYFYIAVIPQTFSQGFSVEILDSNNSFVSSLVTNTSVTIERNHIVSMNTSECKPLSAPLPNQIWYCQADGKTITPQSYDGIIISNTHAYGNGVIIFNCAQTTIYKDAFKCAKFLLYIGIPNSVVSIGDDAFSYCNMLQNVNIPDSINSIGDSAFASCTGLTRVRITDIATWCSIKFGNMTSNPLYYAHNLYLNYELVTNIVIPDGVTSISNYAFSGCTSLTSVTIPNSVTKIGSGAFSGCTELKAFYGKYTSEDNRCVIFDGVLNSFAPASLTTYIIPDSATSIGGYAFSGCTRLKSVTIPDSVTSIGGYAFSGCTSLDFVTIPDSVTSIGGYAFSKAGLIGVIIPDSVTEIGDSAFYCCSSLTRIYCKPATPPTLGSDAFSIIPSYAIIYVPSASVDAYKSADGWKEYASQIYGYDFE